MPYDDTRGHSWSSAEPLDDDTCIRCGLTWAEAAGFMCAPGDKMSRPVPAHAAIAVKVTPSRSVEAAVDAAWAPVESALRKMFEDDLELLYTKFSEYGSADLDTMGQVLLSRGTPFPVVDSSRIGQEMAIGFYALGKVARMHSAWVDGKEPSDDTWRDLFTYALMGRYVRGNGKWGQ